jgi:hypothetical protein
MAFGELRAYDRSGQSEWSCHICKAVYSSHEKQRTISREIIHTKLSFRILINTIAACINREWATLFSGRINSDISYRALTLFRRRDHGNAIGVTMYSRLLKVYAFTFRMFIHTKQSSSADTPSPQVELVFIITPWQLAKVLWRWKMLWMKGFRS